MSPRRRSWTIGGLGLALLAAAYAAAAVFLVSLRAHRAQLLQLEQWFDPLFFEYNVLLLLIAQLLVPAVTLMYVRRMKGEKERRLRRELPDALWRLNEAEILWRLNGHFRLGSYFGSVALVSIVVTMGAAIILLLKPVVELPAGATAAGLDYTLGANFLLMGPFIGEPPGSEVFRQRVLLSLTAFQFGFLGGFVYFIGQLVRSYFMLDLTPHTYVESSVRMAAASLLALVISFALPVDSLCRPGTLCPFHPLPVVAFALGYFPNRAILFIEKTAARLLAYKVTHYAATPLSELQGMSLAHEVMLNREGFDNAENLSQADTIDLAIRTGFGYRQLSQWIGQAWLRLHFGEDFETFFRDTGITTRQEFEGVIATYVKASEPGPLAREEGAAVARLIVRDDARLRAKVLAVHALAATYEPHVTSGLSPTSGSSPSS